MIKIKKQIMKKDKTITTFEEHLEERYGKIGSKTRTDFDIKAKAFASEAMNRGVRLPVQLITILDLK